MSDPVTATPDGARSEASLRLALVQMVAGAMLLSSTSLLVVYAHTPPTVSAFYRMLFGGGMLLVWVALRGRWQPFTLRDVGWALLPAAGLALDLIQWHRSILWIGPGMATLLTNFQVFLMVLAGFVFYRERFGRWFVPGMLLAMVGLWLLVGAHWSVFDARHRQGVWLGLGSGVAYTVYLLSFRQALKTHTRLLPAQFLGLMSLLCASMLWLWGMGEGDSFALRDAESWSALLALGFFGQVLAWLLVVQAMPRLPASLVGLLLLLQPALAFVLDVILLGRPTTPSDWIGLALALAGILCGALRPARRATKTGVHA
ncbi:DMT family transporter [Dyella acidiphila]|uniref:DMT family transporter n=1 Tax=Dyella acidiphila TaxID=2775866 RepID=A0ABR9G8Y5_9GAMM|nr:DMT family transporter [Dyella acidiphila]MBE1160479.1 DMT family transporter [Dyella acidiphila]